MEEEEFTDDFIEEMCISMYTIELLKKFPEITEENSEIKEQYDNLCTALSNVLSQLTEEQCNILLEQHRQTLLQIEQNESLPEEHEAEMTDKETETAL